MRIVEVNAVPYGSTARICLGISAVAEKISSINIDCAFGYSYHPIKTQKSYISIGNPVDKIIHIILSKLTGLHGYYSFISTLFLIKKLKKISPDIIHLHNIHGWYINIPMLFKYIKKNNINIVWTLHDCWAFTGQCTHFDMINCCKWKYQCSNCPKYNNYPSTIFDNSKFMYKKKKEWFQGISNLHIVTPSIWLASKVKESFLRSYPVKVINNGIDLSIFKPNVNNYFKTRYNTENKIIILGVSFGWGISKGLDIYIELANKLDDSFQIVLVGTSSQSRKILPDNIISINITQSQEELAMIYSSADVFLNCTREDNFPTVNIEALACGTPVITFKTGGSPEIIDETCGYIVEKDDIDTLIEKLNIIRKDNPFSIDKCRERAQLYNMEDKFYNYIDLYKTIV